MSKPLVVIPINTTYLLKPEELNYCVRIGSERFWNNLKANARDIKYSQYRSSIDVSIQGVIAEYAFTVLHHLPLDLLNDTTPNSHEHDRGDALLEDKWKLDVKGPIGDWCPMRVMSKHAKHPKHVYALCSIKRPLDRKKTAAAPKPIPGHYVSYTEDELIEVQFKGFATGKETFEKRRLQQVGKDWYYFVQQDELGDWTEVKSQLENPDAPKPVRPPVPITIPKTAAEVCFF